MPLDLPASPFTSEASSHSVKVQMTSVATPTDEQAEGYVATTALFLIFSHSPKEERAYLRLPSVWRDLWSELAKSQQGSAAAANLNVLRDLRKVVMDSSQATQPDHIETNGKILKGPIRHSNIEEARGFGADHQPIESPQDLIQLWFSKASSASFRRMLMARKTLPIWGFSDEILQAIEDNQAVIVCGETGTGTFRIVLNQANVEMFTRVWQKHSSTFLHTRT